MTDDRDALIDHTADTLESAFDRAIATPEGRAAYDELTRLGGTVSVNGGSARRIDPATGEVRRDGNAPDPATRAARLEGYLGDGDPDARWEVPYGFGSVPLGKRTVYLAFGESGALADLAAALVERDSRLSPIAAWETHLVYRWGEDLGKEGSGLRLWRLKKPNPDAVWALGQCRPPRATDLLLDLNARVARHAEFTGWQVQAALHEALGCIKLRPGGVFSVEPLSDYWQEFILRRYGVWRPSLRALQAVMAAAEREQLPLWEEDEDGDDE